MNTEAAPRRPLTNMTREEYQRLFAVAFNDRYDAQVRLMPVGYQVRLMPVGYVDDPNPIGSYHHSVELKHGVCLTNGYFSLYLFPNGNALAERINKAHGFNLREVLALVDELNLEFGNQPNQVGK